MTSARRVTLEYPLDFDVMWTPQAPEFACAANAVSLLMPSIEPFFVKSVRAVLPQLPPEVQAEAKTYVSQEAQHHKQHVVFNELLIARYPMLQSLDQLMKAVFGWLSRSRSPGFNLAFAACAETVAFSAARWAAARRTELFTGADNVAATLFLWHLAEEVEHKSAAFDVYLAFVSGNAERSGPSQPRRRPAQLVRYFLTMLATIAVIVPFILVGTVVLLAYERRLFWPVSWLRLFRWSVMFAFEALTNLGMSLFPKHHPSDLVDPPWFQVWLAEFDAADETIPTWDTVSSDAVSSDAASSNTATTAPDTDVSVGYSHLAP